MTGSRTMKRYDGSEEAEDNRTQKGERGAYRGDVQAMGEIQLGRVHVDLLRSAS